MCAVLARGSVASPLSQSSVDNGEQGTSRDRASLAHSALQPATTTPHRPRMTAITVQPDRLSPAANSEREHRITAKVRTAIEAMVWDALPRKEAAAKAGISEHGLYKALRSPPVRALYLRELDVLRTSERARNIHTLVRVRDQTANQMASVQAVKTLEQMEEQQFTSAARSAVPGLMIVVNNAPHMPNMREIEAKPLIDQGSGPIEGVGTEPDDSQ